MSNIRSRHPSIEKNSSTPIYIQLKNILKQSIMTGKIGENEMIPSEPQLAELYQITRTTVRRAISELVNENILRKEHGKGTFVCLKPISYSMWNFSSFTEYAHKRDKTPVSKILKAVRIARDGEEYFCLERARGVKEGDQILFLTVDNSLIPINLFPGIMQFDFEERSLYDVMRKEYGIFPDRVELSIHPKMAEQRVLDLFGLDEPIPLLMANGQVYGRENQLIETTQVIYGPNVDFKLTSRFSSSV